MTATPVFAIVGQPIAQIDGVAKVSGKAVYTADVPLPGTLWCKMLRSPHPHALIRSIDTQKARALPGVYAIITARDITQNQVGRRMWDQPVLAKDRVRFIGERVAAVAAENKAIAEEAANLIEVDYELLPAVFDELEAMKPGAPLIHPDMASYHNAPDPMPGTPNTYDHKVLVYGDIEAGFSQADRIFEHTVYCQSHHQGHLEPHAAMVQIAEDGVVHVWETIKNPLVGRKQMSDLIGIPPDQIVFHTQHIGADFGGKGSIWDSAVVYWLARLTGHPVKSVMTYTEELIAGNPRNSGRVTMRTGVKDDGTITAHHSKCTWNTGAYSSNLPNGAVGGGLWAAGVYRVPNTKFENIGVNTNCTPRGHVRAPGAPQVVFALETHFDIIARALGLDPVEFRMRNLIETGEVSALGEPFHDLHAKETLQAAAKAASWGSPKPASGRLIGKGIAMYDRHTGAGVGNARLTVGKDGHVILHTPAPDTGTGAHTIIQQIVAEELKIPLSQVSVRAATSENIVEDAGVGANRVTHVYGQAALMAAREAQPRFVEGERDFEVRVVYNGERPEGITSVCTQVAEVEVDPETGRVTVLKMVSSHDVGTVINPLGLQGQIDGSLVYGLGYALTEELKLEEGRVVNPNLGEYKLPNVKDIPPLDTVLVTGATGPAPYGGKAIAEGGNVATAAAVVNAVYDACGVRIVDLPITAEKVYRGLKAKR